MPELEPIARRMSAASVIIDDLSREPPVAAIGSNWQLLTDQVMGGVSKGTMVRAAIAGRPAIHMRGDVNLENNGGFVQIALDLSPEGGVVDAGAWSGIELDVFGNGDEYGVHLRTDYPQLDDVHWNKHITFRQKA